MSNYGLTPNGPNIKRLDTIVDEIHEGLSEKWGVNTKQNPQSFIGSLITNFADKIAELWEYGEDVYYSQYPSTAEGTNLDNAAQYGGSTRETAVKSYYPIHCKGVDGTVLTAGTTISSNTNPPTNLSITDDKTITRSQVNKVQIKVAAAAVNDTYTVAINGNVYSCISDSDSATAILTKLAEAITEEGFALSVDDSSGLLLVEADDITANNVLVLSENLTTETVTTILNFGTVDTGNILIPNGVITNIVKADAGLLSVVNLCTYIAGHDEENDVEFRQSYADKIFNRSSMMLESIKSAILENVQGVESVAPYENASNEVDAYGRPPHSIEIVVDGGDATQIAQQILENKAGGISTFGSIEVDITGVNDEDITVRFNRPTVIYTWLHLGLTLKSNETLPTNYAELLKEVILQKIGDLNAGEDVVPQEFVSELYKVCSGISYIDISIAPLEELTEKPDEYTARSVNVTPRQRAYVTADMIEVEIDE